MKKACFWVFIFFLMLSSSVYAQDEGLSLLQGGSSSIPPSLIKELSSRLNKKNTSLVRGNFSGIRQGSSNVTSKKKSPAGLKKRPVKIGRGSSLIERLYREAYKVTVGKEIGFGQRELVSQIKHLTQFGYGLFSSLSPRVSQLVVPGEDYVLAPGDVLNVRIWGTNIDTQVVAPISRRGTINLPQVGIIYIAGTALGNAAKVIRREALKYIQGINVRVSLAKLRSIEVYVLGEVNTPGLQMVPAFSTVLNALMRAGGVKKIGSLRRIQVFRDGKLYKKVDLYDFILKGDTKSDVLLKERDVIFVPPIGKTVAIVGAVKQSGIYELKGERSLGDVLHFAGNILPQAFVGRIYLRRYNDNREFVVKDIDTSRIKDWRDVPIKDGDLVEISYTYNSWPKIIKLEGNVWRDKIFKYREGIKLSDILTSPSLLRPGSITNFCLLYRYDPMTTLFKVKEIPLDKVFEHKFDMELKAYDKIVILDRKEYGIKYKVVIEGAVWKPGEYEYHPGMRLKDLLALAGGVKMGANVGHIELSRQYISPSSVSTRHVFLSYARDGDFGLMPLDYVFVPMVKDAYKLNTVTISGEVRYPGTYRIRDGERLSDLILRAGGFTPDAYFYGAKYTNEKAREIQRRSIDSLIQELELRANEAVSSQAQTAVSKEGLQAAQVAQIGIQNFINRLKAIKPQGRVTIFLTDMKSFRGSKYDFELSDGDTFYIPRRPNFVAVTGSVYSPGAFLYEPEKRVKDYLKMAGGPTKTADAKHIYVLKANGEVFSNAQGGFFNNFMDYRLMPGDTIVVPENLERIPYLRLIKDISDIVFKIATTAGVAIAVF